MTLTDTTSQISTESVALSYNKVDKQTNQDVTLFYPTAETNYRITRAIAPKGSKFQVGAHWHEDYDEYMRIVQGRAKIRLGSTWKVFTPEDGEIKIPRMVVHDICRADRDAKPGEGDDEDMIIEEWSDPFDGAKEMFFRHIFSVTVDKDVFGWKLPLQQLLIMISADGYIEIVPGPAGWYITHGLYAALKPVTKLLGLKPFHDEYTPSRLADVRRAMESGENPKKDV
ncbi:hypothetical protein PMIN02_001359 [Paraphaeosphaeria minitans]|uniref:Uncharacterized protein n=1 Tax=Paraphaeosphaeria minitans TaxID=565426 RepID=A0A9P6G499_9PLEO|nr:hypothetical protein PMIN01_13202 [Paraphaeosphaeria minitans]